MLDIYRLGQKKNDRKYIANTIITCSFSYLSKSNFNFAESTEWEGISRDITYGNFNTENPIISDNILLCVVLHNFLFPQITILFSHEKFTKINHFPTKLFLVNFLIPKWSDYNILPILCCLMYPHVNQIANLIPMVVK